MGKAVSGRRMAALVGLAALTVAGSFGFESGTAGATALGPWTQITSTGISNIEEVGLARTPDGTLHAAWTEQDATTESQRAVPISPAGSVGGMQTIVSDWDSLEGPALGLTPGGALQAFFGGIHTLSPTDPNGDENLATSTDGGNTWSLTPAEVVAPAASAYSSPVAVSNSFAGQANPLETWYATSGVWVHSGTSSGTPDSNFQDELGSCCGYYSNVASDGAGNNELAWYSNATAKGGIWAQGVAADGTPIGSPQQMPGTADLGVGELERTPLVARPQGGFYVAYPTGYPSFTAVRLWKVGSSGTMLITKLHSQGGSPTTSAAVDQAGRVWVFWSTDANDKPLLFATRSNPSVTRFGAVVSVGAPSGAATVFNVDGNASSGALDVFANVADGSGSQNSIWYRHVYPGLSVSVSPAAVKAHRSASVKVTVTDAGVPVKGASVKLGGHSAKTSASGHAVLHIKAAGALTAVASAAGYVNGSARLSVTK
jgi:hypothetical protein